ncbi:LVIVD repeat-containing protein [Nocardioides panzhihuensis]|uniref:LVIVD repeat-containing protein n=1 Tax=Nocardioides panzhihuensis TaxID=860243 RepID=A0A7Z0DSR5_9ACTN|nr:hypothetical protein [Nocardioides panzhihuensis]NYI81104.1 hypothetical protein [Nocardioides panzhihuensis]
MRRPIHILAGVASAMIVAGGLAVAAPSSADESHSHGSQSAAPQPSCTEAEKKILAAAGDNFASACAPGNDIAKLGVNNPAVEAGATEGTPNLNLIANLPKSGAFAPTSALNSDLAFQGRYAFAGNYDGFNVIDIKKPHKPKLVTQVVCPGSQNDISVHGDLLVLSVDSSRSNNTCDNVAQSAQNKESWEGIRVFDISNPAQPAYVAAVETKCGSHTHSLAPSKDGKAVYAYVSSYGPRPEFPDCQPPHDKISVVKIPTAEPETAAVVNEPVLFPDGGYTNTAGCHDITTYPSKDVAAGACMGDGILMDISDRENPVVTERVRDTANFAFWHSATFNNSGTKVVFTDELGGGGAPVCNPEVGPKRGANGIYDIEGSDLVFKSYYKIPRTQSNTENCVAHNGSLIPVKGKDIMVQAWYQGGISVYDFTDSANPKEIAWFDRGPFEDTTTIAGAWSTYYYNGYIYSNEIQRGFDVFDLRDPRVASAKKVRFDELNVQAQPSY